jgi:hypothetical protein
MRDQKKRVECSEAMEPLCSAKVMTSLKQEIVMPLILWLLGVPLSVVVVLYLLGVV